MNTCGSCGKVISTYEYKYNDQGYVVRETATELEAGTRKTPSWENWYNWGDTQKETDKADCEHQEKEIQTTRTYEYDDNWELIRCTEKVEGGKKTVHNYTYDKIGNRTSYEKIEDGVSKAKYNYKYNDSNQLIKRTNAKIWGDPGTTYSYDKDGNLIQECDKTNSADPVTYEYTAENRLAVVKQGGTVLMAAMYDGDNNRVFELDNTYKWEDCYGDEVLIPENQRTEDGDSPKEQLASLVKGGSNAKGYTLTEYINDINRENTEVLAEYGSDEKVRQAYTYGESGIGERISVDKSTESSYYLYDGRNSVTGILTETANLTNSYQYDSYGNLTSGTADRISDQLGKVDWKKVGIAVVAAGAAIGVGVLTGGVGIVAVGALGLTEGTLGSAIVGGAVTGAIGGATYSGVSSGLSGNSLKQVTKDTLTGGLTGAVAGGAMGGLAYGADKAIGAVKNVIKGSSSSPKPGHITEMATKDLKPEIPSEQKLKESVCEWAKMETKLAEKISKRKADRFNTASVVYDSGTGKYYYGMNKGLQISGDKLNEHWQRHYLSNR